MKECDVVEWFIFFVMVDIIGFFVLCFFMFL